MGRASLLVSDAISPRTAASDGDSAASPDRSEAYPRRFPRLGQAFQQGFLPDMISVGEGEAFVSSRPAPELMSALVPWEAAVDVGPTPQGQHVGSSGLKTPWSSLSTSSGCLFPSTSHVPSPTSADIPTPKHSIWLRDILRWQEQMQEKQADVGRRAKKRPRGEEETLPPLPKRTVSQGFPYHWSGGAAPRMTRRTADTSWRAGALATAIKGDFRDFPQQYIIGEEPATVATAIEDTPEKTWRSVLACAQAIELYVDRRRSESAKSRNSAPVGTGGIYVSQLVLLLDCVRSLPPPEDRSELRTLLPDINSSLDAMQRIVETARSHLASILNIWYCSIRKNPLGVDVLKLRKKIQSSARTLFPIVLDEESRWSQQIDEVLSWQKHVDKALGSSSSSQLEKLQKLEEQASTRHTLVSQNLVQLRSQLQKALSLNARIAKWRVERHPESARWVSNLVKDVERLPIRLPEAAYLNKSHAHMTTWVDRASVAIRSRLSLQQVQELLDTELPGIVVDDLRDKLRTRVSSANVWLGTLLDLVPLAGENTQSTNGYLEWMHTVRGILEEGDTTAVSLHELASEGGRLPVQVPIAQLLQTEIEARSWTTKASKMIEQNTQKKLFKLEELKEHSARAAAMRDQLMVAIPDRKERQAWFLSDEHELETLIKQAETWLHTFESVGQVEGQYLSLEELRKIASDGQAIHVNLCPATNNVNKVLAQAEAWYDKHSHLWRRCCSPEGDSGEKPVLESLKTAVQAAESSIQIDLQEAVDLDRVANLIETWTKEVALATGKVSRRHKKPLTKVDLLRLTQEAKTLPIETQEEVRDLHKELQEVAEWQASVQNRLSDMTSAFVKLRQTLNATYGDSNSFRRRKPDAEDTLSFSTKDDIENDDQEEPKDDVDPSLEECSWDATSSVQPMIDSFCDSAGKLHISTPESDFASILDAASRWSKRSARYLDNQKEVFDKRFYGAFDRFLLEGEGFQSACKEMDPSNEVYSEQLRHLKSAVGGLLDDQMKRLSLIMSDREAFVVWCETINSEVFATDKKPSLEKVSEFYGESLSFPGSSDTVTKVRKLAKNGIAWEKRAEKALSSETKLSFTEAKSLCSEAEKMGFWCPVLARLRKGLKTARSWASRVKKCCGNQDSVHVSDVQGLIEEYETLILSMPEELSKVSRVAQNYCLCRRPYEGFMVECDSCKDWFHGPCIGVSEAKADKTDSFICIRCCFLRTYRSSAGIVAGIVKKWCSKKELRKARQISTQRHLRRSKKETKTLEVARAEKESLLKEKEALFALPQGETLTSDPATEGDPQPLQPASVASTSAPAQQEGSILALSKQDNGADKMPTEGTLHVSSKTDVLTTVPSNTKVEAQVPSTLPPAVHSSEILPQVQAMPETGEIPKTVSPGSVEPDRLSDLTKNLQRVVETIRASEEKVEKLSQEWKKHLEMRGNEDRCELQFRKWCIRVRSHVLCPLTNEQASRSRPLEDGSLSLAMHEVLDDATKLGLGDFDDIQTVANAFACLGWTMKATEVLSRQPKVEEIDALVRKAAALSLPDEKGLRMLKTMFQRAKSWSSKVCKALAPVPGERRAIDTKLLRGLSDAGDDLPFLMPLEARLQVVIEDKGVRHCLCGGPSDGRFMLGCEKCDKWFHGSCVGVDSKCSPDDLEGWVCPVCSSVEDANTAISRIDLTMFHDMYDVAVEVEDENDEISVSPKAPKTSEMWPPYGLKSSDKVQEILGAQCYVIPDEEGELISTSTLNTSNASSALVGGTSAQLSSHLSVAVAQPPAPAGNFAHSGPVVQRQQPYSAFTQQSGPHVTTLGATNTVSISESSQMSNVSSVNSLVAPLVAEAQLRAAFGVQSRGL